ncbi:hypothetical protein VCHA56P521_40269 [Vibrio chagasii]|nr:hypothetical protein VCHA36P168_10070 [Vibrio chagasii]CAH6903606.1 hypothetical protein VCHA40O237_110120 [Vibrio chagasii]CAH6948617.1 hypothetical protein VCHA52P456_110129 [Vibrio chagasii]CAH7088179.1 hypothetical protein VCHA36O163_90062 [Vibrio chagasii]CAH7096638.1 hypothetical protein VCHA53O466_10325 [Vibrio chagasii]
MNCLVSYDNSLIQTIPRSVNRFIFSLSVDRLGAVDLSWLSFVRDKMILGVAKSR